MAKKRKKIIGRFHAIRNRRAGKKNEAKLAKLMGFDRVGLWGGEDGKAGPFSAEWKKRKKYVGDTMMQQAIRNAEKSGRQVPILVVHITGKKHENDLVHMLLKDWLDLFNFAVENGYAEKFENN